MNRSRPPAGLTLIELVMVTVIVAVLSGMAIPRYHRALARYRVEAAARRIAADLTRVRNRARATSASLTVTFDTAAGTYAVPGLPALDDPAAGYRLRLADAPYGASLFSADFGGRTSVVFDGYGAPDSGGSVVVRVGPYSRTVALDAAAGRAVVQ